jgi:hypothetical protein
MIPPMTTTPASMLNQGLGLWETRGEAGAPPTRVSKGLPPSAEALDMIDFPGNFGRSQFYAPYMNVA